jgi:hypothetical protein
LAGNFADPVCLSLARPDESLFNQLSASFHWKLVGLFPSEKGRKEGRKEKDAKMKGDRKR